MYGCKLTVWLGPKAEKPVQIEKEKRKKKKVTSYHFNLTIPTYLQL